MTKVKSALIDRDTDIKNLLLYLKEAEQVLASAVYQSRQKLAVIARARPLPSELIIRYAHKISAGYGVCSPENWAPDNPMRPYPTDVDMRRGWLGKLAANPPAADLGLFDADAAVRMAATTDETNRLVGSNSKSIRLLSVQSFRKVMNMQIEFSKSRISFLMCK